MKIFTMLLFLPKYYVYKNEIFNNKFLFDIRFEDWNRIKMISILNIIAEKNMDEREILVTRVMDCIIYYNMVVSYHFFLPVLNYLLQYDVLNYSLQQIERIYNRKKNIVNIYVCE